MPSNLIDCKIFNILMLQVVVFYSFLSCYPSYSAVSRPYSYKQTSHGLSIQDNPFRYSSYYTDPESKMSYCMARYYDSNLMVFISRDSYDVRNRYAYCEGDPVMKIDSNGHLSANAYKRLYFIFGLLLGPVSAGATVTTSLNLLSDDINFDILCPILGSITTVSIYALAFYFKKRSQTLSEPVRISTRTREIQLNEVQKICETNSFSLEPYDVGETVAFCPFSRKKGLIPLIDKDGKEQLKKWTIENNRCPHCITPLTGQTLHPLRIVADPQPDPVPAPASVTEPYQAIEHQDEHPWGRGHRLGSLPPPTPAARTEVHEHLLEIFNYRF